MEEAYDRYEFALSLYRKYEQFVGEKENMLLASIFVGMSKVMKLYGNLPGIALEEENMAQFYNPKQQESYLLQAIYLYEGLVENEDERFKIVLAEAYLEYGKILGQRGEYLEACTYYDKSIFMYKKMETDSERIKLAIAKAYCDYGIYLSTYHLENNSYFFKAENYFEEAIKLHKELEICAEDYSEEFQAEYAFMLGSYAKFLGKMKNSKKAIMYYQRSIDLLCPLQQDLYILLLAQQYIAFSDYLWNNGIMIEYSRKLYTKGMDLYEEYGIDITE